MGDRRSFQATFDGPGRLRCALTSVVLLGLSTGTARAELQVEIRPPAPLVSTTGWRFFRGTGEPSGGTLAWAGVGFDDSLWEAGSAGFGYGDQDDRTIVADMFQHASTIYLRASFTVTDSSALRELVLTVDFDDGFVAYLNGEEVARASAPGAPGEPVPYDAVATCAHEAGVPLVFRLRGADAILKPGKNVLAVEGLNEHASSSDLTLAPMLAAGAVAGTGCPGVVYVLGSELLVDGLAPVGSTARVVANGEELAYDPATGEFSGMVALEASEQAVLFQALRADESVVEATTIVLETVTPLGGVTPERAVHDGTGSPYLLRDTLTVPRGHSLIFGPGARCVAEEGAGILVDGRIQITGTEDEHAVLAPRPCADSWGGIQLRETREDNEFFWCEILGVSAKGAIVANESKLTVDSSRITDIDGEGIFASSCAIEMRNSEIARTHEAVSADGCDPAIFEYNYIHDLVGDSDCLDPNACHPAIIRYCVLAGTPDDGIDVENGSVIAIGNEIFGCGDQGVSLVGRGDSYLAQNIIYDNDYGVALKNSQRATLEYNTITDNTTAGVRLYEKTAGRGGGHAVVKGSIVYFNGAAHTADSKSTISYEYSDVDRTPLPAGTGNFRSDPLFADRARSDYRLTAASPSIGAGEEGKDLGALPYARSPEPPGELSVAGTTATEVDLAWVDASHYEERFEVHRRGPGEASHSLLASVPGGATAFTDTHLATGEEYSYRVRACNAAGCSAFSSAVMAETATVPRAPDGLVAVPTGAAAIDLSWRDRSEDETAFEIERRVDGEPAFVRIATVGAGVESHSDGSPPLVEGVVAAYRVRASNPHGASAWSAEVAQEVGTLPSAPGNLHVTEFGRHHVTIAWVDETSGEASFVVEAREEPDGAWELRSTLAPDVTSYEDEDLSSGTTYSYRVRAETNVGPSPWAGPVSQETNALPDGPVDVSVVDVGLSWVLLAWRDGGSRETAYEIERRIGSESFVPLDTLPADATTYTDWERASGARYGYRVRATSGLGSSGWCPVVEAVTGALPEAPASLEVTAAAPHAIELAWEDRSSDESRFEVVRGPTSDGPWDTAGEAPADGTTFVDAGLPAGEGFYYRVRAWNRYGASGFSDAVFAETVSNPPGSFVRGDANGDGEMDVSDAVTLLLHLYAGGDPPACDKSADTDGDDTVGITDAMRVLGCLFQDAPAPPEPFPDCGPGAPGSSLTCGSYPPCD